MTLDSATDHQLRLEQRVGSTVNGTYRLERLLGAGGMGAVYAARDAAGTPFAVKLLHPEIVGRGDLTARFWRELKVGQIVNSNHVVPVVDGGTDGEVPFLAMPLLNGYDVAGLLERVGPLAPDIAVRIALQACDGLSAAHREGVVHRDIKPSNLFLHYRPDGEVVLRVCDFGVAKRTEMYDDSSLTRTGASLGSPLYMSPEQVKSSKTVDERTDVWSLSATLYELLCGVTPHGDTTSLGDLVVRICTRNAPHIQTRAPWVSAGLALAIHQGLCRDPAGRFAGIDAFAHALRSVCGPNSRVMATELLPIPDAVRAQRAPRADLGSVSVPEGQASPLSGGEATDDPLLGRVFAGNYRLARLLGRGGMGNVYEAEMQDGARVAVKVISQQIASEGPQGIQRFLREARAARSIDNPHVVRTLDSGTDQATGLPFIVMELLKGVDLSFVLKRQGALMPQAIIRVVMQAAEGVAAAHAAGVVHRDIKPANIFLSIRHGDPNIIVKVCDFGVAKRVLDDGGEKTAHELTRTGGMLGSPMYMSPEQAQSAKTVDHRTDIWSLGITLYEGLTGRKPWDEMTSLGQIIVAICTTDVPPLQDLAPWIPADIASVVHGTLQKDPARRPASAAQLVAALASFTGGNAVISRDELRGVDWTTRATTAPRLPSRSGSSDAFTGATSIAASSRSVDIGGKRRSRGRAAWIASIVGLAVAGVAGVAGYRVVTGRAHVDPIAPVVAPKVDETKVGHLVIHPADAAVTRNGLSIDVVGGSVELPGQPGDSFAIVISKAGRSRSANVVLARDGSLTPAEISLDPELVASGSAQPTPRAGGGSRRPAGHANASTGPDTAASSGSAGTGRPGPAAAQPGAAPATRPGTLRPADEWQ